MENYEALNKLAKVIYESELKDLTPKQIEELQQHIIAKDNYENRDPFETVKMILEEVNNKKANRDFTRK